MFSKEGGDFHPIIFEGVADAEQFIFLAVLVIVWDFRTGVKVVMAGFKPRGCFLRFFLAGERVGQAYTSSVSTTSSADARMLFIRPTHFI